jgi:electron transfer flavoprotein alpha subunit
MRIAVLIKQIPLLQELALSAEGRLRRDGIEQEMNPYCRRAVSKGVELARAHDGECVAITMGPPAAEDVLREAIAWGATRGVHLCDAAFAGSDTLATARALTAAIRREGPFDLVLVGRNSADADTGQVGPQIAQMLGLPFAAAVRELTLDHGRLAVRCEGDDGGMALATVLPAVVSTAERLCQPAKVPPTGRNAVPADRITAVSAAELGPGPWGTGGSRTIVGEVSFFRIARRRQVLMGPLDDQVATAVAELRRHGIIGDAVCDNGVRDLVPEACGRPRPDRTVAVFTEAGRPRITRELLGAAAVAAGQVGGSVVAIGTSDEEVDDLAAWGADAMIRLDGSDVAADLANEFIDWCRSTRPWTVLAPGTLLGREVTSRLAAELELGLIGDATDLKVEGDSLIAWKPAFGGQVTAAVTATSTPQVITIRPGVLPLRVPRPLVAVPVSTRSVERRSRNVILESWRDDAVDALLRADAVIAVGAGIDPAEYQRLERLRTVLGAELGATRKVTDAGSLPRARQIGITGHSIAPLLFVSLGASGKYNHLIGSRRAKFVLAINIDPQAPVFEAADLGIVGDWREVVPRLASALSSFESAASRPSEERVS